MLLKEQEVAIIPGDAFGASGEGYARISYAYSVEHLETAMRRIRTFLKDPRLAGKNKRQKQELNRIWYIKNNWSWCWRLPS